jgi:hypothetical protein
MLWRDTLLCILYKAKDRNENTNYFYAACSGHQNWLQRGCINHCGSRFVVIYLHDLAFDMSHGIQNFVAYLVCWSFDMQFFKKYVQSNYYNWLEYICNFEDLNLNVRVAFVSWDLQQDVTMKYHILVGLMQCITSHCGRPLAE